MLSAVSSFTCRWGLSSRDRSRKRGSDLAKLVRSTRYALTRTLQDVVRIGGTSFVSHYAGRIPASDHGRVASRDPANPRIGRNCQALTGCFVSHDGSSLCCP